MPHRLTILALLLLLATLTGCASVGRHEPGIDNFDQVSSTLFRGAQPAAAGFQTLADRHIKTVINLRDGDDTREAQLVHTAGMAYIHLPLDAEKVTPADGEKFLAALSTAQTPVFVHCLVGRDRTGLAVAAYRLRVQDWDAKSTLQDLMAHGHDWLLYPKVRASILALSKMPAPLSDEAIASK